MALTRLAPKGTGARSIRGTVTLTMSTEITERLVRVTVTLTGPP